WRFPSSVPSRPSSSSASVHPASADFLCSFCWGRLLKGLLSNLCTRGPSAGCTRTMCHMDQGAGSSRSLDLPMWMDSNSCWIVRPQPDSYARQGGIIETGTSVRLQHTRTRRWLHSYLHASPLSGNLEVGEVLVFTWILIFDKGFEFLGLISVSSNCQLMKS
ncbi:hypothetical protein GW17_00024789, partial [Ensete ventricosum]